jgi:spore germination protein GerM
LVAVAATLLSIGACTDDSVTTTSPAATNTTPPTTSTATEIDVFFSVDDPNGCGLVEAFPRSVPTGADPIEFAFAELLAGPVASDVDAGSLFGPSTAGLLISAEVEEALLVVDFEDFSRIIPNASTSCGSQALTAQLNATAFQFEEVEEVVYSFNGSCDAFGEFMQTGCTQFTR